MADATFEASEHYLRQISGHIAAWVAWENQDLRTVVKTVESLARKYEIDKARLRTVLEQVRAETVQPFFGPPYEGGAERNARLNQLEKALHERGIL